MSNEFQELKEEIGGLAARMGNVEGYFDNFNTTLENHMEDYKAKQDSIDEKVSSMGGRLSWTFWVTFSLLMAVIAGFIGGFVALLQAYIRHLGG